MKRKTRQQDAIGQAIKKAESPFTPQDLLEEARVFHPGLGVATVYRALKNGLDEGTLVSVDIPGQATHYEKAHLKHHHHFVCRICEKVFEMHGCPEGIQQLAPAGFFVDDHEVILYGACDSCNKLGSPP